MPELISVRECARRIGVSDTAVHKALKAGHITIAGRKPESNRPLLEWPKAGEDWMANRAHHKRTHSGGAAGKVGTAIELPIQNRPGRAAEPPPVADSAGIPDYNTSRAAREFHQSELARLEVEEKTGKLVDAQSVERNARRLASAVIAGLYTIPDRISDELAGMADANEIQALLLTEIDRVVDDLRCEHGAD